VATVITTVEPTTVTVGSDDDVTIATTTQTVNIEVEVAGPQGGQGPAPVLTSTVATGTTIGTGAKTFTVDSGLSLNVGEYVRISDATTPTRYMAGYITSYSGTTLGVTVISGDTAGSGALGAGILSITGPRGATGAQGSQGSGYADVTSTTSFTMATGSKVFDLTTVLGYHAYVIGQRVRISNTSSIYVEGTITAVSATSMTVNVTLLNGSGTYTSWTFGITGSPGTAGTAATIAAGTTTTGAAGSSATVTNSGTSSAAVFDFTIPRGATGDTGPSGVIAVNAPLTNAGTSTSANLSVSAASTSAAGVVQLTDSTASTSVTTAATPKNVKTANDAAIAAQSTASSALNIANGALPLDGSLSMTGTLDMFGQSIINANDIETTTLTVNSGISTAQITNSMNSSAVVTFPSNSGQLVGTNDTGVVTSDMILNGTILNADINASAAIAQSKLALQKYQTLTDSTVDVLPRYSCNTSRTLASGGVFFTAYTPEKTMSISSISLSNQVVCNPISGTNKFQVGIFSAVGSVPSSVTCISFSKKERTTTTTTPAAFGSVGSNTLETFALGYTITNGGSPTTNGAPTSVTLTAGTTYWIGIVGYASAGFTTGASVMGMTVNTYQVDPYIGLNNTITSTDFAVSTAVSAGTGSTIYPWFRLS